MTVVRPGELSPASRMADLSCAEGTGVRYSMGAGSLVPRRVMGQRPPSASDSTRTPMSVSGSRMRRMGRLRREASPSNVASMEWPPTTPIISRVPVPALPKSRTPSGWRREPTPHPSTCQRPGASRSTSAPRAAQAAAVRSTSSPSSRPSTVVRPFASSPRMSARWEMDLSPGGRRRPFRGAPAAAERGWAGPWPEGAEARELSACMCPRSIRVRGARNTLRRRLSLRLGNRDFPI